MQAAVSAGTLALNISLCPLFQSVVRLLHFIFFVIFIVGFCLYAKTLIEKPDVTMKNQNRIFFSFFCVLAVALLSVLTSCGTGADDTGSVSFVIDGSQIARATSASALAEKNQAFRLNSRAAETIPTVYLPTESDEDYASYALLPPIACYVAEHTQEVSTDESGASDKTTTVKITAAYLFYSDNTFLFSTYVDFSSLLETLDLPESLSQDTIDQILSGLAPELSVANGIWFSGTYTLNGDYLNGTLQLTAKGATIPLAVANGTFTSKAMTSEAAESAVAETLSLTFTRVQTFKNQSGSEFTLTYSDAASSDSQSSTEPSNPDYHGIVVIALRGDYTAEQSADFTSNSNAKEFTFDNIPIGSTVSADAAVVILNTEGISAYYGLSKTKMIAAGENPIGLKLAKAGASSLQESIALKGKVENQSDTYTFTAYEPTNKTGLWKIEKVNADSDSEDSFDNTIAMGTYTILEKDTNNNPASVSVTEYFYRANTSDKFSIVATPTPNTLTVSNNAFTFTSKNGLTIKFDEAKDEPKTDPDTPEKSLTALTLTPNANEAIVGGDPVTFTVKATYSDSSEEEIAADKLKWTSSDETIATVSSGVVTALAAGEVTITASMDGKSGSVTLTFKLSTSGTITTEIPSLLTLSISNQTTLYLNAGSVSFLAKTQDGNAVASESITWDAKLLYKGREIENPASAPYYTMTEQGIFEINTPLPVSGSYQLFVTATYNGLTSSATFEIEVEDYRYAELDFTGIDSEDISAALTNALSGLTTGSSTVYFKLCGQTSEYYTNLFSSIKSAIANASPLFFIDASDLTTTYSAKDIQSCAMQYCSKIQGLILPDDMDLIGGYAFANCSNLETVVFGKGLKSMSTSFDSCAKLSSVTFPEDSSFESFGNMSFSNCSALKTFKLPASIKGISANAFYGSAIEEFILEDTSGTWYYTFNYDTYWAWMDGTLEPPSRAENAAEGSCGLVADLQTVSSSTLDQADHTFPEGTSLTQKLTWLAKQTSNTGADFTKSIYLFHKSE